MRNQHNAQLHMLVTLPYVYCPRLIDWSLMALSAHISYIAPLKSMFS